ncbi:hypothetical protein CIB93_09040 [Streptomyces sp. WZ.A104]|uniref:hypothetical protein n=1 Tax=Streptomyces sp. WZ.A104 TaxID=2023771 RepID=UPI000BBC8C06|nr:hypothetical protein [Streptomyces sp. WZ.A104]PCG86367.1 hypothetical protein CIB93_09040 [Streptomyces sp. WZ.A104]
MRVHRNRHDCAFVVMPNQAARHKKLSLTARGLLVTLLSMPDEAKATVESITDAVDEGRQAVSKAFRQLEDAGYLRRERYQHPETGRWCTQTHVSDLPSNHIPAAGEPGTRSVGGSPKGVKNRVKNLLPGPSVECEGAEQREAREEEGRASGEKSDQGTPAEGETGKAASTLARLADADHRLKLSTSEVLRLTPLAAVWLTEGHSSSEIVTALTTRLPETVDSAAALVSYRLKNQMPAKPKPRPKPAPDTRARCEGCGAVFPQGRTGTVCGSCRDEEDSATIRGDLGTPAPAMAVPPEPSAVSPEAAELLAAIRQRRDSGVVAKGKKCRPVLAAA